MTHNDIFSGVKVLELASVLAGPSVGQFFAELGAEVIKVENPKTNGDVTRSWKRADERTDDISAYFSCVNWGKQSLALDYSQAEGLNLLYQLLEQVDIIIISFKPGDAEKLKLGYEDVKRINSEILYGSITGFGAEDTRAGYDAVVQAESGFMSINGEKDGLPLKLPVALMDILASHHLKEALLLAYIEKLKTGKGREVTISLIDAAMASLANQGANWLVGEREPNRTGSLHPNIAPYGEIFKTADDKLLMLAVGTDKQFQSLIKILKIAPEPKYATNQQRIKHREELFVLLEQAISLKYSEELVNQFNSKNIPCGIVNSIPDAINKYKNLLISDRGFYGIRTFAAKMDKTTKPSHFLPPPHYGEHTDFVLKQKIGLSSEEIADLKTSGVIY